MTDQPNAHQPTFSPNRITCIAPGCDYAMHTYKNPNGGEPDWAHIFRQQHTTQHGPGRAPDISIDYAIDAICSVCTDGIGDVQMCDDGDAVCCKGCGTHWDMNGAGGQREESSDADDPIDEPDATGGLLDPTSHQPDYKRLEDFPPQPPINCGSCDYTTTDLKEAMAHAQEQPGHALTGDGRLEGTTLTISIDDGDENDDEEWDESWGDDEE